ncbi:MAG: hypothetical protein HY775_03895 [Acidobacteria bacterium]|nr:hypothetical protein [Acidobacteriota bacterium]
MTEALIALVITAATATLALLTARDVSRAGHRRPSTWRGAAEAADLAAAELARTFVGVGTSEHAQTPGPAGSAMKLVLTLALIGTLVGAAIIAAGWTVMRLLERLAGG